MKRKNEFHGLCLLPNGKKRPEYMVWVDMRRRCYNPKYKYYHKYGGRGIVVCERWRCSFSNFFNDMGERPSSKYSIERDNVNGNYEPSNCRWATIQEQNINKTTSRFVEYNGDVVNAGVLAKRLGRHRKTIYNWIKWGWILEVSNNPDDLKYVL